MTMNDIRNASYTFGNNVTVINATPHALTFQDTDGSVVLIPSSVPEGEKTGPLVINARAVETPAGQHLVRTEFVGTPEGDAIIQEIAKRFGDGDDVLIVGSIIAAQAYPGKVVGMVAAPGFERVPPAEKRMSCEKFTTFAK